MASPAFQLFLPCDDTDTASSALLAGQGEDLAALLASSGAHFWASVQQNASLHAFLKSYLRYARCVEAQARASAGQRPLPVRHRPC